MARQKKEGERFCCYLRKDILELLTDYSDDTGVPKTVVVEKALLKYLADMGKTVSEKKEIGLIFWR